MLEEFVRIDPSWRQKKEKSAIYETLYKLNRRIDYSIVGSAYSRIAFGIIEQPGFGGAAFRHDQGYAFGINEGSADALLRTIIEMLQKSKSAKVRARFTTEEILISKYHDLLKEKNSRETIRDLVLTKLIIEDCLFFLMLHELAHIVNGHIDVDRPISSSRRAEQNIFSEVDADRKAIGYFAQAISTRAAEKFAGDEALGTKWATECFFRLGFALGICFALFFENMNPSHNSIQWYPHPQERMTALVASLVIIIGIYGKTGFIDTTDAMNEIKEGARLVYVIKGQDDKSWITYSEERIDYLIKGVDEFQRSLVPEPQKPTVVKVMQSIGYRIMELTESDDHERIIVRSKIYRNLERSRQGIYIASILFIIESIYFILRQWRQKRL